ncbi:MAG: hypothetical protein U9M92_02765 [Patescibacteria group bacterium]|nr:hypothetical protein [Patescibacteria group bacterium]
MKWTRLFFLVLLLGGLALGGFANWSVVQGQTSQESIEARRARLQAELEEEERQIAVQVALLKGKQMETATVEGEVELLQSQIAKARANVATKRSIIGGLEDEILASQGKINQLEKKIITEQDSLAELLRQTREFDDVSLLEIILNTAGLSEFFRQVDHFASLQAAIHSSLGDIRDTKSLTSREKALLENRKDKELDAKKEIEYQQRVIEEREAERQVVLDISKQQEKTYEQIVAERRRRAAEIRAALFALRDTAAIPFGKALEYANAASAQTGVRAALILAILTQESNLGEHQGSCLIGDLETGNGSGKNTGTFFERVVKAPRDTVPFKNITARLGLDWKMTPVSCPPGKEYYSGRGFGGGMGPSQFIPSTWELFKSRVGSLLGIPPDQANPWEPRHSFMATAIYIQDLGAIAGSYTSERNAACRYYSGAPCTPGRKPANLFYGNQVMAKAQDIQLNMIDPLRDL